MRTAVCRLLLPAAVVIAGGCHATTAPRARSGEREPARVVSRQPAARPEFGGAAHAAAPARAAHSPLVGLYGELSGGVTGMPAPYDGSSNVAQITFASEGACSDPDVNRAGDRLVFSSTQHSTTADIYLKPIPGRTLTQITTDPADDIMPAFAPAGDRIAFASNRSGNWDIYVVSTEGGQPMKVTDQPEPELHPAWAPDGRRLVYCKLGAKSGRWEMWVIDTEHSGVRRFLDYGLFPQWCPDPARPKILFQRARQRGSRLFGIWTLDFVDGDAVHPTEIVSAGNAAVINPAWSPDARRIVFVTVVAPDESDVDAIEQSDIWIVNLNGAGRTNLTNGRYANYQPVWSSDGRVYFVSDRTGTDNIWAVSTSRAVEAPAGRSAEVTSAPAREEAAGRP